MGSLYGSKAKKPDQWEPPRRNFPVMFKLFSTLDYLFGVQTPMRTYAILQCGWESCAQLTGAHRGLALSCVLNVRAFWPAVCLQNFTSGIPSSPANSVMGNLSRWMPFNRSSCDACISPPLRGPRRRGLRDRMGPARPVPAVLLPRGLPVPAEIRHARRAAPVPSWLPSRLVLAQIPARSHRAPAGTRRQSHRGPLGTRFQNHQKAFLMLPSR